MQSDMQTLTRYRENEIIDEFIWNRQIQAKDFILKCLQNLDKMAEAFADEFNEVHRRD